MQIPRRGEAEKVNFKAFILNSKPLTTKGKSGSLPVLPVWGHRTALLPRPGRAPQTSMLGQGWVCGLAQARNASVLEKRCFGGWEVPILGRKGRKTLM